MKKIMSALAAFALVLLFAFSAFAAEKSDVKEKIDSSVKYGFDGAFDENGITAYDAGTYIVYLKSGDEGALAYKNDYIKSVKVMQSDDEHFFNDICNLALVIQIYDALGEDTAEFKEMFKNAFPDEFNNPYVYPYAVETAVKLGETDLAKSICDYMIENYYTLGEGTDFWGGWGTSADDLSVFILTLSSFSKDYSEYIQDAVKLVETFAGKTGYGYDGEGNADSTAYVLAAYSSLGNKKMADKAYDLLLGFFNSETGGFEGEWDSALSTRNAVFGLEYYLTVADDSGVNESETKPSTDEEAAKPNDSKSDDEEKSPATGAAGVGVAIVLAASSITLLIAKKENQTEN